MKRLLKLTLVLATLAGLALAGIVGVVAWVRSDLPEINSLSDYRPPMNSRILARDGSTVLLDIGKETRDVVPFKRIPPLVVEAFLAAEDDNFWNHKGVDYMGILRAFAKNLMAGRLVQGGSTITQQVAKSLLLTKERTISRKVKDFLLAQEIERKFSKQDILFLYLNQVYLGGGYYGVKAAFRGYFDKDLGEVSVAESALVAGLLVAPGRYSPYVNPLYAKRRQLYVLKRMHETGKITDEQYDTARNEEIKMRLRETAAMKGGHFTDWVRQQVMDQVGSEEFLTQGYQVVTTLDWQLQKTAEEAVMRHVKDLDKRQGYQGPTGRLTDAASVELELKRQRQALYREASTYFHFTVEGTNRFEFQAEEDGWAKHLAQLKEEEERLNPRFRASVVIGNFIDDPLVRILKPGKTYPAAVVRADDAQRVIYASIGGARVVIPAEGFAWAHERKLDEEPRWFPPVTKPSSILAPGDQILVRIKEANQSIWPHIHPDQRKKFSDPTLVKVIQSQKFLVGELDQRPEAEGALVAIQPHSGEVLALVGGVDFGKSQFNRALQAARQPGSSFKPFIYAAALEEGYTPSTQVLDTPQALGGVTDALSWKPRNYDGEFMGTMTFRKALEISRNIPTIRILQDVGVDKVATFSRRIGLKAELPQDMSIGLGSFGLSLAELVKGYAVFANSGKRVSLRSVLSLKDRKGGSYPSPSEAAPPSSPTDKVEAIDLEENPWRQGLAGSQVYDPRLAHVMTQMLRGVVQNGTAAAAKSLSPNIAGKTGTTNNFVDALFVGYSQNIVAGTWVGLDDNRPLGYGESGGKTALPIWIDFMQAALAKYGAPEFDVPEGILSIAVNRTTGRPARSGEADSFLETFAVGMNPESSPGSPWAGPSNTPGEEKPAVLEDGDYYMNQ